MPNKGPPRGPRKPASLPLRARYKPTTSRLTQLRVVSTEHNRIAKLVVDYLHKQILRNRAKTQHYFYGDVSAALGIALSQVRSSLPHTGASGIVVEVTPACRAAIKEALLIGNSHSIGGKKREGRND